MGYYKLPDKAQLSTLYGVMKGARGGGRIHHLARRYGYDHLILQALRIKLRYPLGCPDIDRWIDRLVLERDYGGRYYHTNVIDHHAITFRKGGINDG